jgi:hypothetical protein
MYKRTLNMVEGMWLIVQEKTYYISRRGQDGLTRELKRENINGGILVVGILVN